MWLHRPHRDSVQKLVTQICVEASDAEMARMIPRGRASAEGIIVCARMEVTSSSLEQRAKWRAFWSLQLPRH